VALVLLMMTMFAEIFTLATGSMSKQKALAELDQRQRMASTLLRADIRNRTFRTVYPFHPADTTIPPTLPDSLPGRMGYIYISDNDPENDQDDVLQMTVTYTDGTLFYGNTKTLLDSNGAGVGQNPNQPENDDGDASGDGAGIGTSPSAEIAYFVRNGNLYRRVLLIRKPSVLGYTERPMSFPSVVPPFPVPLMQPGIYPGGSVSGGTTFPRDFDYSATYNFADSRVEFLGQSRLSNVEKADSLSLGRPVNRFGFGPVSGRPVEYVLPYPTPGSFVGGFIGRFTHEETSHPNFGWPGNPGKGADGTIGTADDTNPYVRQDLSLSPGPLTGVVGAYAFSPALGLVDRSGEDILLTNVQCFDVKIWDPLAGSGADAQPGIAFYDDDFDMTTDNNSELGALNSDDGGWVDIGHNGAVGLFAQTNNRNSAFGPLSGGNHCFDTWHPSIGSQAPFRPATSGSDSAPGIRNVDDDGDGTIDNFTELGWPNSDDIPIPVRAIQIRLRYRDNSSGLSRDITIVESLQ
jgi:hypothetical protein